MKHYLLKQPYTISEKQTQTKISTKSKHIDTAHQITSLLQTTSKNKKNPL